MAKPDPYADIDFEEINDQTNLATDEIKCLKNCFDLFDKKKQVELKNCVAHRYLTASFKELLWS